MMTSRERLLSVLNGRVPDRVPVTLFILDEGHFLKQVCPEIDVRDYMSSKLKVIDVQRKLGVDIHLRLWSGCLPMWLISGGVNTERESEVWHVKSESEQKDSNIVTTSVICTPDGRLEQEFTISQVQPGTFHYACTKKPVKSIQELELVIKFEPTMSESYPKKIKNIVSMVKQYLGEDGILSMWLPGAPFSHASRLVDLDELYSMYLCDSHFYERLMSFCIDRTRPFVEAIADTEIDVANISGNVPGGFIGQENYVKYVLSHEKRFVDILKQKGKKTLYHNCGQAASLVEAYEELGCDIVESFSGPPLGDCDLKEVTKIVNGQYVIIGNVDQVNVLQKGGAEMVRQATKEAVLAGKTGGSYILQPTDFLEYGTPIENVMTYVETGLEYGNY